MPYGRTLRGSLKSLNPTSITSPAAPWTKKAIVPADAKFIEAEMQTVGFADATEKKSEFYWRNNDLVPDARPKGGVK